MASYLLLVVENGRRVRKATNAEIFDFFKVRIGTGVLEISENAGRFDFNNKKLLIADATTANEAVSLGQLDSIEVDLQADIQDNLARVELLEERDVQHDVDIADLQGRVSSLEIAGNPLEEFLTRQSPTNYTASTIQWINDDTNFDVEIYVNDRKQIQVEDYSKISSTEIQFTYNVDINARVRVRNEAPGTGVQPFFVNYDDGLEGQLIPVGDTYSFGQDTLGVYRNGLYLAKSSLIGLPADKYAEQSSTTVLVGQAAIGDEVFAFIHQAEPPIRIPNSGLSGLVLTVPTYVGDELLVYRSGKLLNASALGTLELQYSHTTSTTITLGLAAELEEYFIVEVLQTAPIWRQDFTSVTGPTLTFSNPYTLGNEKLLLFRNGVLLHNSTLVGDPINRYQETTTTTATLEVAAEASDVFTAINLA